MSNSTKFSKLYKYGFSNKKKKFGVNYWRFFFNGLEANTAVEQMFFIELEMLNPWQSPNETVLGFKPRVKITEEDLQYALAGTSSAQTLETESMVQPSYCVIRFGKLGENAKQLCAYFPVKDIQFNPKNFELIIGNKCFSEEKISGFLNVSQEDLQEHPEYLCDTGYATWNLTYDHRKSFIEGYNDNGMFWFPYGIQTHFAGTVSFNGTEYIVDPRRSYGYVDRYWGKTFPATWFHMSSNNISSIITGKSLFNSSFSIQGAFEDRISFIGNFEGSDIKFCADEGKRQYNVIWDCSQMPDSEDPEDNLLHWSVSLHNKIWVIDVDIYCRIKELNNRTIEIPEGNRKVLNMLEGGTGTGEIKLYKRVRNTLEQIENAKINKAVCEFGHTETLSDIAEE